MTTWEINSAAIREARKQFERWRCAKEGRERIPPELWKTAAELCETYGVHRIARCLGLSHTALKDQFARRGHPRRHKTAAAAKPAFVEWSLPAGVAGNSSVEYVVEAPAHPEGMPRIHVRGASVLEVAALARALRTDDRPA